MFYYAAENVCCNQEWHPAHSTSPKYFLGTLAQALWKTVQLSNRPENSPVVILIFKALQLKYKTANIQHVLLSTVV